MTTSLSATFRSVPAFILLLTAFAASANPAAEQPATARVRYSVTAADSLSVGALVATVDGKTHPVVPQSNRKCMQIVSQRDFEGKGTASALVMDVTACGGNCCPNSFFFVSYLGNGQFKMSKEFADSWKDPVIEKWKGQWSVVVTSNNEGMNRQRPVEITRRFVLQDGEAVEMEETQRKDMPSLVEMRSEIFTSGETHTLRYDLDGDGQKDVITGKLWERWGRILWAVRFANGKEFSSDEACKRIGVLSTTTNGVHDLVCDQDKVFHWNGEAYK